MTKLSKRLSGLVLALLAALVGSLVLALAAQGADGKGSPPGRPASAAMSVSVEGPATGRVKTSYDFQATVNPPTVTRPITYVWRATGGYSATSVSDQNYNVARFTWDSPGAKAVTVTATSADGSAVDSHPIVIAAVCYLPIVLKSPPQAITPTPTTPVPTVIPPQMTLYLREESGVDFLDPATQPLYRPATFSGSKEWTMALTKDLVGDQYAYHLYVNGESAGTQTTCDVEILLRRGGSDTVLASWPSAFSTPYSLYGFDYQATLTGIDPSAQAGDTLVLRVTTQGGKKVTVYMGRASTAGGDSSIKVPGYPSTITPTPGTPTATATSATPGTPGPAMTLYLRKQSGSFFLDPAPQQPVNQVATFSGSQEWTLALDRDLVGTQYGYDLYVNGESAGTQTTCDVEILLRRSGGDTVLASWPSAFTVAYTLKGSHPPPGALTGPDPDVQAGDILVLRITTQGGKKITVYMGPASTAGGNSLIKVPAYAP